MSRPDDDPEGDEFLEEADRGELDEVEELQVEATVSCPYCGEACEISLDPGGGRTQSYVEDCPVCCRPWQVHVSYSDEGTSEVWLEEDG